MCISYLHHISIQISHISNAKQTCGTSGYPVVHHKPATCLRLCGCLSKIIWNPAVTFHTLKGGIEKIQRFILMHASISFCYHLVLLPFLSFLSRKKNIQPSWELYFLVYMFALLPVIFLIFLHTLPLMTTCLSTLIQSCVTTIITIYFILIMLKNWHYLLHSPDSPRGNYALYLKCRC